MAAALGEADMGTWLSSIVHRHKSCFNTPYATNTFVFLDEDPTLMKETEKDEPGFLISDFGGLLGFKKTGLSALDSGRVLKECAKLGLDPEAVSQLCLKSGLKDLEGIITFLPRPKGRWILRPKDLLVPGHRQSRSLPTLACRPMGVRMPPGGSEGRPWPICSGSIRSSL